MSNNVFIIAEAGVNHNGDINLAKKLVDVAVKSGADAIKFQTWKTELLVTPNAEMAEYQIKNTEKKESQFDMLKKLELSYSDFLELKKYCDSNNIIFMSTPDEFESADFLNGIQDVFKIGSGELTNIPFLRHVAKFGKKMIISTGMAYLSEIEQAVITIHEAGLAYSDIVLLHATTDYPTAPADVNLNAIRTIMNAFPGISVGYSDHTLGIEIPVAAVAIGARYIEKHFTLDRTMEGPDHPASLEPEELFNMVLSIRNVESALGDGWKVPTRIEQENRRIVRKSIVANTIITKGEIISSEMIAIKRPGTGIAPSRWNDILGSVATQDYNIGDLIK